MSAVFLTVPKLSDGFCDPEKPLFRSYRELLSIEATKLQPLSQDSMEQKTASKKACKLSLIATLSQEPFIPTSVKNASHLIDNG